MTETTKFVCIGCPIGCPLRLEHVDGRIEEVTGHECNRGAKYAKQEFTDPRRELSTTVAIRGGLWERLPVKVAGAVPKDKILEAARLIHSVHVEAPVKLGDTVLETKLEDEPMRVVATRSMSRSKNTGLGSAGVRLLALLLALGITGSAHAGRFSVELEPLFGHQFGQVRNSLLNRTETPFGTLTTNQKEYWPTSAWLAGGRATFAVEDEYGYRSGLTLSAQTLVAHPWTGGSTVVDVDFVSIYGAGYQALHQIEQPLEDLEPGSESFGVGASGFVLDARGLFTISDHPSPEGDMFTDSILGYRLVHYDFEGRRGSPYIVTQRHRIWHHILYSGLAWRLAPGEHLDVGAEFAAGALIAWATDGDGRSVASSEDELTDFGDALLHRRSYGIAFMAAVSPRLLLPLPPSVPLSVSVGVNLDCELRLAPFGSIQVPEDTGSDWPSDSKHGASGLTGGVTGVLALAF